MMKKTLILLILMILVGSAQAQQSSAPTIQSFTAAAQVVDRTALQNRRVRIPVSWNTVNRPLTANLYFEQVLPDNSWINVELPRLIPWVASTGDGVVAPIEPFSGATEITLRVRLVDFFTQQVYSERSLTIPIGTTGDPGTGYGSVPTLTRFTIQSPSILRSNLGTTNGRIGVTWTAINRPITATLVFEQVMPDGTIVNVELPRANPWVNSSDSGVVMPRDPGSDVDQIRLRVRLIDLITGRIYDQRGAIVNILTPQPAAIQSFASSAASVGAQELAQHSARIPVTWTVSDRPQNSNLVFEQQLSNGSRVNVELPRSNLIVPSVGVGVVAPIPPGGDATEVLLLLRLIDLSSNQEYARAEIHLPIAAQPSQDPIASFNTSAAQVMMGSLMSNSARIPVTWALGLRPANSNLVFEQRLLNGQLRNVELPRSNPIVPSAGTGIVAPIWPGDNAQEIVLVLRLIDLSTNATLDSAEISLPIVSNNGGSVQYGATCLTGPYGPTLGLAVGTRGHVVLGDYSGGLHAYNLPNGDIVETLPIGETFEVIGGPACWTIETFAPAQNTFRAWRIRTDRNNMEGWVQEYRYVVDGGRFEYYLQLDGSGGGEPPVDSDPQINSFTATPATAAPGSSVTLSWEVANASAVSIEIIDSSGSTLQHYDSLPLNDELAYSVPADTSGPLRVVLAVTDTQGRPGPTQELSITLNCGAGALDPTRCPATQTSAQLVMQSYQNGFMLWRGDTHKIYVLYQDGSYQVFDDTWTEDQPYDSGEQPPSEGLLLPNRGFGKVWTDQAGVRDRLGWAISVENSFTGRIETYEAPDTASETYMGLSDGRVLVLGLSWRMQ